MCLLFNLNLSEVEKLKKIFNCLVQNQTSLRSPIKCSRISLTLTVDVSLPKHRSYKNWTMKNESSDENNKISNDHNHPKSIIHSFIALKN